MRCAVRWRVPPCLGAASSRLLSSSGGGLRGGSRLGRLGGFISVYKPVGMTSHDAVDAVRDALVVGLPAAEGAGLRVGHSGTLDPLADGVLLVAFGFATRLLRYMTPSRKTYETVIAFGQATVTDDRGGGALGPRAAPSALAEIDAARVQAVADERFVGCDRRQRAPLVSALRFNGVRAHEWARAAAEGADPDGLARMAKRGKASVQEMGEAFAANWRCVDLHSIVCHGVEWAPAPPRLAVDDRARESADTAAAAAAGAAATTVAATDGDGPGPLLRHAYLTVDCGPGTYIRALARDLGDALGVGAHVHALTRTRNGRRAIFHLAAGSGCAAAAARGLREEEWATAALPAAADGAPSPLVPSALAESAIELTPAVHENGPSLLRQRMRVSMRTDAQGEERVMGVHDTIAAELAAGGGKPGGADEVAIVYLSRRDTDALCEHLSRRSSSLRTCDVLRVVAPVGGPLPATVLAFCADTHELIGVAEPVAAGEDDGVDAAVAAPSEADGGARAPLIAVRLVDLLGKKKKKLYAARRKRR